MHYNQVRNNLKTTFLSDLGLIVFLHFFHGLKDFLLASPRTKVTDTTKSFRDFKLKLGGSGLKINYNRRGVQGNRKGPHIALVLGDAKGQTF